jgi:hypothetical protein
MSNSTSTLERTAATNLQHSFATVYSREQQEQLLILQAEVELLLIQIQTQAAQPATAA